MEAVLYVRQGCEEYDRARDVLQHLGVPYVIKDIGKDRQASREWEELDGTIAPLLVIDRCRIVRGLDQARMEQLLGWGGC